MSYISIEFLLLFLPLVILIYAVSPKKYRYLVLLLASYVFYYLMSKKLIVFIIMTTITVYGLARLLQKNQDQYKEHNIPKAQYLKYRKRVVTIAVLMNLLVLVVFKYFNFFASNINGINDYFSISYHLPILSMIMPIGISFYTLQAISYVVDVYRGKLQADHNIARVALFLSFFPTIIEGPITHYQDVNKDLFSGHKITYINFCEGTQRIVWGLFKNIVIADRLNLLVKTVFSNYSEYGGIVVIFAAIAYTFQLYMNFAGTIDISIGVGRIFNVHIPENFKQPFFSKTASEFWQRWHISLGRWFKEYIFYSVSLSKFCKRLNKKAQAKLGKFYGALVPTSIALFAVWLANGLWHGAKWSYVFFGLYYFVIIIIGKLLEPLTKKIQSNLHINVKSLPYRIMQSGKLLIIVFVGELFFRAEGLRAGIQMFLSIFQQFSLQTLSDGSLLNLGLSLEDLIVVIIALLLVLVVSIINEKGYDIYAEIGKLHLPYRWAIYYAVILMIVVFGAYGDGYLTMELIYAGF